VWSCCLEIELNRARVLKLIGRLCVDVDARRSKRNWGLIAGGFAASRGEFARAGEAVVAAAWCGAAGPMAGGLGRIEAGRVGRGQRLSCCASVAWWRCLACVRACVVAAAGDPRRGRAEQGRGGPVIGELLCSGGMVAQRARAEAGAWMLLGDADRAGGWMRQRGGLWKKRAEAGGGRRQCRARPAGSSG
jgi:hypothetical protein